MQNSEQQKSLDRAAVAYNADLDDRAVAFLAARGLSREVADLFLLGVAANPLVGHDHARGRLSIPYQTRGGIRSIKFRCLDEHDHAAASCPKYIALSGSRPRLYNVEALFSASSYIAVCEGEMDTIVTQETCGIPAVGVPGVTSWLPHFPRVFEGFDQVFVLADNDDKKDGRNPGRELADRIGADLSQAITVLPPKGMDLTEWVVSDGPEAVRKACGLAEL